jgi:hypothetical protein
LITLLLSLPMWWLPYGGDLLAGNGRMVLYGKVVDQMGSPIANSTIEFTASAASRFRPPILFAEDGERSWIVSTTTMPDGSFTLDAGRGQVLYLGRAGETGYVNGDVPGPFYFGRKAKMPRIGPDREHPVSFMRWNAAFKRIISKDVTCRPGHGNYFLEYLSGKIANSDEGFPNLTFSVLRPGGRPIRPYDWTLEVRGVRGGVADADGPIKSEAPAVGYAPKLNYEIRAADHNWSPMVVKRFYTRSSGYELNSPIHGLVEMTVVLGDHGEDPAVTIHYTANFDNSRDLTPGPVMPAKK